MQQGSTEIHSEITNFADIQVGERYSGFGVVLDSTRAIRVNSRQSVEYNTQIKLIDKSMNPSLVTAQAYSKGYVTFFMFWTSEENQPFPFKIGDIIRFNNFDFERYKGFLQGKNKKGSSWAIFHGDNNSTDPYCQSFDYKERMSQELVHGLNEYRQWTTAFFQVHSLKNLDWYSYERHSENPSVIMTFDMLLKVEELRLLPEPNSGLLLVLLDDKMKRYQINVTTIHARFLFEGEIVKLRSIEAIDGEILKAHQRYFAVLGIPDNFRDAREFTQAVPVPENQEEEGIEPMNIEDPELEQAPNPFAGFDQNFFSNRGRLLENGAMLSSAIALKRSDIPLKTGLEVLKDLESHEYERIVKGDNKYCLRLTLIDVRPKSLMQSLRNECKSCRMIRKLDAPEGEQCCSMKMEKTMLLRLLWQDMSLKSSKKLLITYVAPGDGSFVKNIFPEFPLKEVISGELESHDTTWESIIERYLEDDRLFDILVEPFDNISLKENDGQVPLRITDTMFVPVLQ